MKQATGGPLPSRNAVAIGTALQVFLAMIAVAFLTLFVWVVYGVIRRGPEARARVVAAQRAATMIMQSLEGGSSAIPVGTREESSRVLGRGRTYLTQAQTFDAPGPALHGGIAAASVPIQGSEEM
ncbi:MAG: hypothetical protein ABIP58_05960 [Dehalococcoidia bacterium]